MVTKYILTGHILEVYTYEKFNCGKGGKDKKVINLEEVEKEISETTLLNYSNHNRVRSNMIRRLACANFNNKSTFVTLTFDDSKVRHDIHNVIECNKVFKLFIMRLKYYLKSIFTNLDFKYLSVIEFQDKNDRRAVHYHLLLNVPYVDIKDLEDIWGMGYCFIEKINHVDNVGAYLIKYMTKDNNDERLMGKPAYLRSHNLVEPVEVISIDDVFKQSSEYVKIDSVISNSISIYEADYETEFMGKCHYAQYNLER